MKTIREQFEEIWPVPTGVGWSDSYGEYMPFDRYNMTNGEIACEWDARLDTFTRCQESQTIVTSLNDELVGALTNLQTAAYNIGGEHIIDYAQLIVAADFADDVLAKARGQS